MAGKMSWREFGNVAYAMKQLMGDQLERAKDVASLQSTALDIEKKRRELQGPSPREKYREEQRSQQVGSALGMFADLYKTSSPARKKEIAEKMGSLWNIMGPGDKAQYEMIVSHTPINPRVQKAMWFEETNPAPRMPIVKEGDGSWTNNPPRTPEYRKVWAEFDVAMDEWNTLRDMAMDDEKGGVKKLNWKTVPKHYPTEDPNVTTYRDPIDRSVKFFNWTGADQAEIANAVEQKWATFADMQRNGVVPISAPKDYVRNNVPFTVRQVKQLHSGATKLEYKAAGPIEEVEGKAPKEILDAVSVIDAGLSPKLLKDARAKSYHMQIKNIIESRGEERFGLSRQLQQSVASSYRQEERYIPFVPKNMSPVWYKKWYTALALAPFIGRIFPDTSEGKGGNVVLVRADRLVGFRDKKGVRKTFWWDEINKIAFDNSGIPIIETQGRMPEDEINLDWSK